MYYNVEPFITKTVEEIVSGYPDPLLKIAKILDPSLDSNFSILNGVSLLCLF